MVRPGGRPFTSRLRTTEGRIVSLLGAARDNTVGRNFDVVASLTPTGNISHFGFAAEYKCRGCSNFRYRPLILVCRLPDTTCLWWWLMPQATPPTSDTIVMKDWSRDRDGRYYERITAVANSTDLHGASRKAELQPDGWQFFAVPDQEDRTAWLRKL